MPGANDGWLSDLIYTGAPDECNFHWPTKLVDGRCPEPECPFNRDPQDERRMWL